MRLTLIMIFSFLLPLTTYAQELPPTYEQELWSDFESRVLPALDSNRPYLQHVEMAEEMLLKITKESLSIKDVPPLPNTNLPH